MKLASAFFAALVLSGCADSHETRQLSHMRVTACVGSWVDLASTGGEIYSVHSDAECRTWWYQQPWTVAMRRADSGAWMATSIVTEVR